MANRREKPRAKSKVRATGEVPFSPPQTELDANLRNILTHLIKHLGSITIELGPLPEDGFLCWDVAQRPDGSSQMTVWWADEKANMERKAG
jgi:hypothetical protein